MSKLLVITQRESVLGDLLLRSFSKCDVVRPEQVLDMDLDSYDAFAVLGGTESEGITLLPVIRKRLDMQIQKGKRFFAEFVRGIGQLSFLEIESTRFARPVLINPHEVTGELERGTILDEQSNQRLFVYKATNRQKPILQYVKVPKGFYRVNKVEEIKNELSHYALWQEGENLLVSSFRLCNFAKAKFAPRHVWATLFSGIIEWLGGCASEQDVMDCFDAEFALYEDQRIAEAAQRAIEWFKKADMLVHVGNDPYCVKEGLASDVYADGTHKIASTIRNDCTGEAALAYYLSSVWKKSAEDLKIAKGLLRMPLDMQITEACPQQGMVRGSIEGWWHVSYQDDTARGFLLPLMFYTLLSGDRQYIPQIQSALDYLVKTTGIDGLRCSRFDFYDQFSDEVQASAWHAEPVKQDAPDEGLRWKWGGGEITGSNPMDAYSKVPGNVPSAHYNAFYMAALLFGYKLTGDSRYYETGLRGITTLMKFYPYTAREHSETQEYCRLLLPLAMLSWVSDATEHKEWLYRVAKDLQRFRHPKGGYIEWDTNYTAMCAGVEDGESSVLCENGDPIMDLLYSLNWLPNGFAVAYYATGDEWFKQLWTEICQFLANIQIKSKNERINGVWPRAFDADLREVYGVPNDVGWAPWSVESGWTVAEIASGMILGLMEEEVKSKFQSC